MNTAKIKTLMGSSSAGLILAAPMLVWAHADGQSISQDALVSAAQTVSCELENGDITTCTKYVVKYVPDNLVIGPFCPKTTKQKGGIWHWDGDETGLYRIDESFLTMLSEQGYTFFNEEGQVLITDVRTSQPASQNTCLQASFDKSVEMTILLPKVPVKSETVTELGTVAKVGLALDGVPIFADAPSVLDTGHMPALDTCGGHIDPGGWYHWHATSTDINSIFRSDNLDAECAIEQNASAMFAYAFDGFPIYGSREVDGKIPSDLDECNGHIGTTPDSPKPSYHYHASTRFPNLPTCLTGVVAKNNFTTNAAQGIGAHGGAGPGQGAPGHKGGKPLGFEEAAKKLGITANQLFKVVEKNGGRKLDISAAAKELGVSEATLKAALPKPPR